MANDRGTLDAQYYLVAFVDVLGQQEALAKIKHLPDEKNQEEVQEFIQLMKDSHGVVDGMQRTFFNYFDSYAATKTPIPSLPPDLLALYQQCRGNEIKKQRFTDGLVIFVSLNDTVNKCPIKSMHGILMGCASMVLLWMAGRPLRAGIEIGMGWEANPGEIYGPVVAQAYRLENKVAKYPRIVIGDGVFRYLDSFEGMPDTDRVSAINKGMAEQCHKLMAQDTDGRPILDYLGKEFKDQVGTFAHQDDFLKIERFANDQHAKWMQERNTERAFRYVLLKQYIEARRSVWI